MDDWQLIRGYLNDGSEAAFAELVRRYVDLVYSVALRRLGNCHDAEEVAQRVFCQLARKARGLSGNTNITGWLHQAACFESLHHLRSERRRRERESEVARMNLSSQETENLWQQIAPHLDAALHQIDENDRTILLRRFFQRQSLKEVGSALGVTEDAARMRVNRALEKLRDILARGGVASSVVVLAGILPERAVQAAPAVVVQHVLGAVMASIQSVGAVSLGAKALSLITGSKAAIALISALLLAVAAVVALRFHQSPVSAGLAHPISRIADTATGPVLDVSPEGTTLLADSTSDQSDLGSLIAELRRALREKQGESEDGTKDDRRVTAAIKAFGPDIPAAIPVLIEGLRDPVGGVRSASLSGFLRIRPYEGEAVPPLLALARDENQPWVTRYNAVESLRCLASPRAEGGAVVATTIPELIAFLKSDCTRIKMAAANCLGTLAQYGYARESVPALIDLLTYTPPMAVVKAAREADDWMVLCRSTDEPMPNDEEASLRKDIEQISITVRREAMRALALFRADAGEAVPDLCEFLRADSDPRLNVAAAEALSRLGPAAEAAVPLLKERLSDNAGNLRVRTTAAMVLWRITGETNGLEEVLAESAWIRQGDNKYSFGDRVEILGEMGPAAAAAVPNLIRICNETHPEFRRPALAALTLIDPQAAAAIRGE